MANITTTDQKRKLLNALFGEAKGDPHKAKELAGYPAGTNIREVFADMPDDIIRDVEKALSLYAYQATVTLIDLMITPTQLGANIKLAAANSLLDRAGLVKKDKLEVTTSAPTALLFLPPKDAKVIDISPDN